MAAKKSNKVMSTKLKKGDPVMVIAGGNSAKTKELAGLRGNIKTVLKNKNRVIVEGLNYIKRHKKARTADDTAGVITKEGSVHLSNVMYYSETVKKPVRLKYSFLDDGKKVRGFTHPETKEFEQIDV